METPLNRSEAGERLVKNQYEGLYKDAMREKAADQALNRSELAHQFTQEEVDAQVRSLDRLFSGKSEAEIKNITNQSLKPEGKPLLEAAMAQWQANQQAAPDAEVIDLDSYRQEKQGEESAA